MRHEQVRWQQYVHQTDSVSQQDVSRTHLTVQYLCSGIRSPCRVCFQPRYENYQLNLYNCEIQHSPTGLGTNHIPKTRLSFGMRILLLSSDRRNSYGTGDIHRRIRRRRSVLSLRSLAYTFHRIGSSRQQITIRTMYTSSKQLNDKRQWAATLTASVEQLNENGR